MGIPVPHERLETPLPSLDFFNSEPHQNGNGRLYVPPLEWESKGTRPIAFNIAGVANPVALLEYMQECHCDELETPRDPSSHAPEFHHLYFPRPLYDTRTAAPLHKKLHRLRYNQIEMLSCQEDFYHQQHVSTVPPEEINKYAAERYLEEAAWVDSYAATSFRLTEVQNLAACPENTRSERSRLTARVALLNELNTESMQQLDDIVLIPSTLVYGALQRYARRNPEKTLVDTLLASPAVEQGMLKPKIQSAQELRQIADNKMARKIGALGWSLRRLLLPENSKLLYTHVPMANVV